MSGALSGSTKASCLYFRYGAATALDSSTSYVVARSMPARSARTNASLTATFNECTAALTTSFMTAPDPTSPSSKIVEAKVCRIARGLASASASAPASTVSSPRSASGTPPDTGVSMSDAPRSAALGASALGTSGVTVLVSQTTAPSASPASSPSRPSYVAAAAASSASDTTTTAAAAAAARAVGAVAAPISAASASAVAA